MDPIELEARLLKAEKWTARYRADAIVEAKRAKELASKLQKLSDRHTEVVDQRDKLEDKVQELEGSLEHARGDIAAFNARIKAQDKIIADYRAQVHGPG